MQTEMSPLRVDEVVNTAEAPSQDIEDFIYLISHDVRASVRALIELPQWIEEDLEEAGIKVNGSVASSIELMNRHTGRLDRMLVDLLTFSRVGRMQSTAEVTLSSALDEVLEEMKIPSGFSIERNLDHPFIIMGDRDAMTLLRALISNAIKHHDKDRGRILISSRKEGPLVGISVCDNGPGIEETYHQKVFAPMATLRPRDEVEGSGMGLAISKKIAGHYGGSVNVGPSPLGRGTQIDVHLPLKQL